MLNKLPDDIIEHVIYNLNFKEKSLLNCSMNLPEYLTINIKNKTYTMASRINLYFRIYLQKKIFLKKLSYHISSYFKFLELGTPMLHIENQCIMYAPHVPNGKCRFCSKNILHHKYYNIVSIYNTLKTLETLKSNESGT